MERPKPLLRLPSSFLILAVNLAFGAAVITGGVGVSQATGGAGWASVDWTAFKWSASAAALIVLLWAFGPIDWITDEEITDIETAEHRAETRTVKGRKRIFMRYQLMTAVVALALGLRLVKALGGRRVLNPNALNLSAPIPNTGSSGAAVMGVTLGSVRLLGHDWTGIEILVIVPLTIYLGMMVWSGLAHIIKANRAA